MSTERSRPPGALDLWDRWPEVDRLLDLALDRPSEARTAFLAKACGDDIALLDMVQSLLEDCTETDGPLGTPGHHVLRAAFSSPVEDSAAGEADSLIGTEVGAYSLKAVLGVGGMGAVYLGERADGAFSRSVAVKILHRALETPELAAAFRLERQILASLNHPGIAQLIDGGVTADGRHYLVMEYVEGTDLGRFCDEKRLGVDERIRVIMQVMDAVEYAHRQGVIHRDLKPGNILVTSERKVKLLDFGIAKLLDVPGTGAVSATTRPGARFATPEYAAPEQLLGERVSTQSDVYTLAALLYELLTGQRPYANRRSGSVLERVVEGSEPTAPSAVVAGLKTAGVPPGAGGQLGDKLTSNTTSIPTSNDLRRRLAGDLDAILLRGLRSRPEERYGSVSALRDDLKRHLSGEVVTARGDAFLYRARKFTRRNRVPVAAASAVFLLATGSAVGLGVQRSAVLAERNRAEAAAVVSAQEAETARQVTAFLVDLFEGSDPLEERGDTLTVRSLLDRGAQRVDTELADQPAVRASLLESLGEVYVNLGSYQAGTVLLERAANLRRDSLPEDGRLLNSLLLLASGYRQGRMYTDGRPVYEAAIAAASAADDQAALARAYRGLAQLLVMTDEPDSAEAVLGRAADLLVQADDSSVEDYLSALNGLAGLTRRRGDLARAERLYGQVLEARRRTTSEDPNALAVALNNLAIVRRMQDQPEDAALLYREALDTLTNLLGAGHPTTLMVSGNLARAFHEAARPEESVAVYRGRVEAATERWPEGHWRTGEALMGLGAQLVVTGRPEEAIEPLAGALDMMMIEIGPMHAWTDIYRGWLGTATALANRTEASEQLFAMSLRGLSSYDELREDDPSIRLLRALVERMEDAGLAERAAQYRALLPLDGSP